MPSILEPLPEEWIEVPQRAIELYEHCKQAAIDPARPPLSPTLRTGAELLQFLPSTSGIPNAPMPLTSMLAGGMLGAGVGYGTGWLGEKLLPRSWTRGRLKKTLGVLGGMAGTVPGALWAYGSGSLLNKAAEDEDDGLSDEIKEALWDGTGSVAGPLINVNAFNQVLWSDPRVAGFVPLPVRAAASGLLLGASHLAGNEEGSNLVSPMDVGRIAVGMGSGYMSGALVGKALGLLTGLPQQQQDLLKNTGMYAGIVNAMVPKLFGAS